MPAAKTVAIIAGQLVLGGAERQLYLWLSHLDRERFSPVVVTLHPDCQDYWERAIEELGIDVIGVRRRRNRLRRVADIRSALGHRRPELIHGWHLFASPYAGAVARLNGARASLGSVRGSFRSYVDSTMTAALTNLLTDGLVVNSGTVARQVAGRRWLRRQRVFAVPNAVERVEGDRADLRRRFGDCWRIPESRVWIGSIGRLEKSKRFDLLLELTASLVRQGVDPHLVLIGYGHGMKELRAVAKALGIEERVTFTGEDPAARYWIGAFDVFCFTSIDEGLPNVVMEAAAAGVPVLAWRSEFLRELLDEERAAVLVEPGDVRALRDGLCSLIGQRELRRSIGDAARKEILAKFGVAAYVRKMSAVYDELLERKEGAVS